MVNVKPDIATALSTDSSLIALVPKVSMFDGSAVFKSTPSYPYIKYEELANIEGLQADDEELESEVTFRFHVWHTASTSTIAGHINRIVKSIGFTRNYARDQDEVLETGQVIKHKILSYSGNFTV